MRTTLDLPDDVLRCAKIEAAQRRCTLRQLVIDALRREMAAAPATLRPRLERAPVTLASDAPLRTLRPEQVKRLDTGAVNAADEAKARAVPKPKRPRGAA